MTDDQPAPAITSDAMFVIACPTCRGHVSAAATLAGRLACCPLCAATFVIPTDDRSVPRPSVPTSPEADTEPTAASAAARQLRRLNDEERRSRRSRRTIVLLLVGAAILSAIVILLGGPR